MKPNYINLVNIFSKCSKTHWPHCVPWFCGTPSVPGSKRWQCDNRCISHCIVCHNRNSRPCCNDNSNHRCSLFFSFFPISFFSFLYLDWIGSGQKLEHTKETAKQSSFWTLLYSISKISLVFRIQGCVLFWPLAKTVFAVLYIIRFLCFFLFLL